MIEVLQPGLFTTVQDLGRDGHADLGVSPAGACDAIALRVGNLLLGNPEGAPALEATMLGGSYRFHHDSMVVLTGAAYEASLDGLPVEVWGSFRVKAGQVLRLGATRSGARGYLCVAGGIDVPRIGGSASTHALSGLGGRALRAGDRLAVGRADARPACALPHRFQVLAERGRTLRVTVGAQSNRFRGDAVMTLLGSAYGVQDDSNRMGLRLHGSPVAYAGDILSEGVALGSVQILPSGQPVLLFVDAQTTGGYPVIACVISADLCSVGQLRPRDEVRFEAVTVDAAVAALREQERLMAELRAALA
jgi:biotin-dependent carboxylase-like uncharacterized protein